MYYAELINGTIIRSKDDFSFNEKNWFVGDVGLSSITDTNTYTGRTKRVYRTVESFSVHSDKIVAYWSE